MVRATYVPAEYKFIKHSDQPAFFSGEASPVKTTLCLATPENGWKLIRHDIGKQSPEDERDMLDSLEALKEPRGISLEDLKQDLGA